MQSEIQANQICYWPVFLIGCHRSGTTVLRFLLDSHENLACPPETKFISGIEAMLDYPQALKGLQSLGFSRAAIFAELRKTVEAFLGGYARQRGKRRWIDKTPNYYRLLPFIDELFERRVLYLFIVRHPLDCVASLESTWTVTPHHVDPDLARAVQEHGKGRLTWVRYWNEVNERILVFQRAHAERCHTIQYEDLVRTPNPTLRGICEFLGEPFKDELIHKGFADTHTTGGFEDPKIRSTTALVSNRIGVWRSWPSGEAAALWKTVQDTALEFGYTLHFDEAAAMEVVATTQAATEPIASVAPAPTFGDSQTTPLTDRFRSGFEALLRECELQADKEPAVLDWHSGFDIAGAFPHLTVFSPLNREETLPYLDATADIVVVNNPARRAEAARVAKLAAVIADPLDGMLNVEWKCPIPAAATLTASLIIHCSECIENKQEWMRAMRATLPAGDSGELILVANANSAGIAGELAQSDARVKVVLTEIDCGSASGRNCGARAATGEILVFLDCDAVPQAGSLPPLLRIFRQFPHVGAAGGKIIYPNGSLQAAGGLIFNDGHVTGYGNGDSAIDAPIYQYVREVDYCSSAMLATRASVFEQAGGFDGDSGSSVYLDADYCLRLRERGYVVYYQPESIVVRTKIHTSSEVDRKHFATRWASALQQQPKPPEVLDRKALLALATWDRVPRAAV